LRKRKEVSERIKVGFALETKPNKRKSGGKGHSDVDVLVQCWWGTVDKEAKGREGLLLVFMSLEMAYRMQDIQEGTGKTQTEDVRGNLQLWATSTRSHPYFDMSPGHREKGLVQRIEEHQH